MQQTVNWLRLVKGPNIHPLILPMVFAEFERRRLLNEFSSQKTKVNQKILAMENKLKEDQKTAGKGQDSPGAVIQEITQNDCDSTKLCLSISDLKNGLDSLKKQLESISEHAKVLSRTIFTMEEGQHADERASGNRIVARLDEMIAEIEGKVRICDGLSAGMVLSVQMVSCALYSVVNMTPLFSLLYQPDFA